MKTTLMSLTALAIVMTALPVWAWPGCEEDILSAIVHEDTLTVLHEDADYNCCVDGFDYSVDVAGSWILIDEIVLITESCPCLCCYDLAVTIGDLAPGEYTVYFQWYDDGENESRTWTDDIIVLDIGQTGSPSVAATDNSSCLDPSAVLDPEVARSSWGRVKVLYR